jgi:hypothetical protein
MVFSYWYDAADRKVACPLCTRFTFTMLYRNDTTTAIIRAAIPEMMVPIRKPRK